MTVLFGPFELEIEKLPPTEGFLQPNPDTAMLFSPFGCIYQPTPCPNLLLTLNLSPKDIAGSDITNIIESVDSMYRIDPSLEGTNLLKRPRETKGNRRPYR